MTATWNTVVEQAADTLGEMLVELASEGTEYSHEDIAAATVATGIRTLLGDEPDVKRVDAAAKAIFEGLHDDRQQAWEAPNAIERRFWLDLARAALRASDAALLTQVEH